MNIAATKQQINSAKNKREVYALAKEFGVKFTAEERKINNLGGLKWDLAKKLGFDLFENLNS